MYLTHQQKQFIRDHCNQALQEGVCLIKSRPLTAKVMSLVKVRHRDFVNTPTEMIIEKNIGIPGVLSRSIEIDWAQTQSSVYVLPFNGYDWRPIVFERRDAIANSLDVLLLEQIVTDRFSEVQSLSYVTENKIPLHIFGVQKYVAIRTAAYPRFTDLLSELK